MIINKSLLLRGAFAAAALLAVATPAKAISIGITSTSNNTAPTLSGGGSGDRAQNNTLTTTNSGTSTPDALLATVVAGTRFTANVAADRGSSTSGGTATASLAVNYTVNFSVTPDVLHPLVQYTVTIDTSILGAATALDDASGTGGSGNANITNVAGFLGVNPNANLSLANAASQGGTSSTSGVQSQTSGSNQLVLGPFTGVQNLSVRFTWNMSASSPQGFVIGGDETSVRLGGSGPLGGASADEYPGIGGRNQANDGHFVNITATMVSVPEPSTMIMAGMAGLGLVVCGRRRSRRA